MVAGKLKSWEAGVLNVGKSGCHHQTSPNRCTQNGAQFGCPGTLSPGTTINTLVKREKDSLPRGLFEDALALLRTRCGPLSEGEAPLPVSRSPGLRGVREQSPTAPSCPVRSEQRRSTPSEQVCDPPIMKHPPTPACVFENTENP